MMKNKIMIGLLLAGAGFGQDVQAMGGARNFAKKVFFSKTAVVAGIGGVEIGVWAQDAYEEGFKKLQEGKTSLPKIHQDKVSKLFKKKGFFNLQIIDGDALAVAHKGEKTILILSEKERAALRWGRVWERTGERWQVFKEGHAIQEIKHEVCHVVNLDGQERLFWFKTMFPFAVMIGKMARVAGSGKLLALGFGCASGIGHRLGQLYYIRFSELRADTQSVENKQEAQLLAQALRFEQIKFGHEEKEYSFLENLTNTHPSFAERIENLERRWGPLDLNSTEEG